MNLIIFLPPLLASVRQASAWQYSWASEGNTTTIVTKLGECPQAIHAHISYGLTSIDEDGNIIPPDTIPAIYNTLISCPNVTSLNLHIEQGGCMVSFDDPWSFTFKPGDIFPPLKELRTTNYEYDASVSGLHASSPEELAPAYDNVDQVAFSTEQILKSDMTNLGQWLKAMDWSTLEALHVHNPSDGLLRKLNGKIVPSLRDLSLTSDVWRNLTAPFLRGLTSGSSNGTDAIDDELRLESISLVQTLRPHELPSVLNPHSFKGVKSFELRAYESQEEVSRATLGIPLISQLRDSMPNLQTLSIDIDRNGSWPYHVFHELSQFEALESLRLWVEISSDCRRTYSGYLVREEDSYCLGEKQYRQPMVNEKSAIEVFNYLRQHKKGKELKSLELIAGNLGKDYGGGLRMPAWLENKAYSVSCSVIDHEDNRKASHCVDQKQMYKSLSQKAM